MHKIVWNLEKFLEEHGKTRYELAQTLGGNFESRLASIYRLKSPNRLDFTTLADLIGGLRELTGEEVTPNDLLEYKELTMPERKRLILLNGYRGFSDTDPLEAPTHPFVWYSEPARNTTELTRMKSRLEELRDQGGGVPMRLWQPPEERYRDASETPDVKLGTVSIQESQLVVEIESWSDML